MKHAKAVNFLVLGLYLLVDFALLFDSYKNPNKFENITLLNPAWLLLLVLVINFLVRFNRMTVLSGWFINLNKFVIFPAASVLTIVLSVWAYLNPPNLIYSRFPFNPLQFLFLAVSAGMISLINARLSWLKENFKVLIFLAPLFFIFTGIVIWFWPNDFFISINKEDHLVENTQVLFLIIAMILSWAASITFLKSKTGAEKIMGCIYLIMGLGLFFIAGEEISWGQRIFGIMTPEFIANQNSQREINIHNSGVFSDMTHTTYMLIGLYGSLSWGLFKFNSILKLKFSRYFLIPWYLSFYFFPIFIYNLLLPPTKPHGLGEWSEMTELALYGGMLGFVFINYVHLRTLKRQPI